jgi:hypothetical protein
MTRISNEVVRELIVTDENGLLMGKHGGTATGDKSCDSIRPLLIVLLTCGTKD